MTNEELVQALQNEYDAMRAQGARGGLPSLLYAAITELSNPQLRPGTERVEIGLRNGHTLAFDVSDAKFLVSQYVKGLADADAGQDVTITIDQHILVNSRDVSYIIPSTARRSPKY